MERARTAAALVVLALLFCPTGRCEIGGIVVTSAASFEVGMPAKGSIASVFCTGVQVSGTVMAETLPLPFTLAGVRVWVGGAPAPLFGLAAGEGYQQINIQVPQEAELGAADVEVVVEQNGQRGSARAPMRPASPGEFFRWPGTNFGIFQHWPDYSLVTPENPARLGETIIAYLTGMPGTTPTAPTGAASPFEPLAVVPRYFFSTSAYDGYTVYDQGDLLLAAKTLWAGLVPGLAGVYQINLVLPESLGGGDRQVVLIRSRWWQFGIRRWHVSSPVTLPVR